MDELDIQDFWNRNPCGDLQVGGLEQSRGNYEEFLPTTTVSDTVGKRISSGVWMLSNSPGKKFSKSDWGRGLIRSNSSNEERFGRDLTSLPNRLPGCKHVSLCVNYPINHSNREASFRFPMKITPSISFSVTVFCTTCPMFWQPNAKSTVF